ncbi:MULTISPECIES: hypothetical protein [Chromatiaceae]|uniref:hypothetical protein n=1 Tax=Chromatiaceae TaxID=1046 RepID=UPI0019080EA2|nr:MULTISPECIES: hypothetical protein [Chromatiaceae]MBK1710887.1 hypothetical protein [Marichromatium gracile]MBK1719210.1 hypothetical protein [Thiocystis violacea]
MAKITKKDYAETVDLYLLDGILVEDDRRGRWSWRYSLHYHDRDDDGQPDTRTFKTHEAAVRAATEWLKTHDSNLAGIAKHHASEWMRYNHHTFY